MIPKRLTVGDTVDVFNGILNWSRPSFSYLKGEFVNTDDYDIVPKRSYKERLMKMKEEELTRLKESQQHYNTRAEEEQKRVQAEIDRLKRELSG